MIRLFIFIAFALLVACDTASNFTPPSNNYFVKYFGEDGDQSAVDMVVDTDGSIYILGNSVSSNLDPTPPQQVYLAKVSAKGDLVWQRFIGKDVALEAKDIEFTSSGKLIFVANRQTTDTNMDILVKRYEKDGTLIDSAGVWSKVLGSNNNQNNALKNEYASSITELKNGYFLVTGYTDNAFTGHTYDVLNIQLDNSLAKMISSYNETNGSGTINKGARLIQNKNSLYIFGSCNLVSKAVDDLDYWTWTIDGNGSPNFNTDLQTQFTKTGYDDVVTSAVKSFIGYGVAGVSSLNDDLTLRVVKIAGDSLRFNSQDIAAIKEFSLGTGTNKFARINNGYGLANYFIVTNSYASGGTTSDILLLKLDDQNLNELAFEEAYFGGIGDDTAAAVEQLPDGRILVLGTMQLGNPPSQNKIALIKVNSDGKLRD